MAREDIEIKGEIIGELEDIDDPTSGLSLLEAIMVERVDVENGKASITLIFDDDVAKETRWALEDEIHDAIEDIEGIEDISIHGVLRSVMDAEYVQAAREREAALTSSEDGDPTESNAQPEAQPETEASVVEETQTETDPAGLSVYSGGGCASGTVQEPAPIRATPPKAAAPPTPTPAPPTETTTQTPRPNAVALDAQGRVAIDLDVYTRLVQDQRELALRPSLDEYNSLKQRYDLLQSKVQSLQDAIRAFLRT